jgi:hypothetical protein
MGTTEEIFERDREQVRRLAGIVMAHLRAREGAIELITPVETRPGLVQFRCAVHGAPITISLQAET